MPLLALTLSGVIGGTALLAFTVFLFAGPWKILVLFGNTGAILAFDLCLSMLFFAQHSGMIRQSFKTWLARHAPPHYHGAVYSIAAGICLYGVVLCWQVSDLAIVTADDPARFVRWLAETTQMRLEVRDLR